MPSPFPPATTIDALIWDSGYLHGRTPGSPDELDFLRGFHNPKTLADLRQWLQTNSGTNICLSSVWQDKYGNVVPNPVAPGQKYRYQEIADLAVIVRDAQNSQISSWMWLLQAKVVSNSLGRLPSGDSTDREIYLYESMPDFSWYGKHSLGFNFQLRKDFPGTVADYKHWSFLCFREKAQPCPSDKFIDVRWPGSSSNAIAVSSFCEELLNLVSHFSVRPIPANVYGAPLENRPNWEKLAEQILHKARAHPLFGHASNVKGQKEKVHMFAMMQAGYPWWGEVWVDAAQGHICSAGCPKCFPSGRLEDMQYSFVSTGFDRNQPRLDMALAMQEKSDLIEGRWERGYDDKESGDGRREPPGDSDQGDEDGGGAGARLILFVDVASEERLNLGS